MEDIEDGVVAAGGKQCPFDSSTLFSCLAKAFLSIRFNPVINQFPWENPFPGDPRGWNPLRFDQCIDLFLMDSQIMSHLFSIHHLVRHRLLLFRTSTSMINEGVIIVNEKTYNL
jgi:hypothetical protein